MMISNPDLPENIRYDAQGQVDPILQYFRLQESSEENYARGEVIEPVVLHVINLMTLDEENICVGDD